MAIFNLMRNDVQWTWVESHWFALNNAKQLVTCTPVLNNQGKKVFLENDASDYTLGSALFQDGKPITYASRTLSDAEKW